MKETGSIKNLACHDDVDLGVGAVVGMSLPTVSEGPSFVGDFFPGDWGGHRVGVGSGAEMEINARAGVQ